MEDSFPSEQNLFQICNGYITFSASFSHVAGCGSLFILHLFNPKINRVFYSQTFVLDLLLFFMKSVSGTKFTERHLYAICNF